MTDQQILTICIAVIFPLSMLIYSNSRITDAKETLRAEMGTFRAELGTFRAEIKLDSERLANKIDHIAGEVATLKEMLSTHLREHHGIK